MKNENIQLIYNPELVVQGVTNVPSDVLITNDKPLLDYSELAAMEYERISNINTLEEYLDYKLDLLKTKDIDMILFELTRIETLMTNYKAHVYFMKDQGVCCNEDLYDTLEQYKGKLINLLQQKHSEFSCNNQMED